MALALSSCGHQDAYLFDPAQDVTWDVRRMFLREPYTTVYGKLSPKIDRRQRAVIFTFQQGAHCNYIADMVNDLDLVLPISIGLGSIAGIKVIVGNNQIDCWEGTDMTTLIETMCAVFKRKISRHGDKLFVPLALAPLHSHNMIDFRYRPIVISIEFVDDNVADAAADNAEIYGKMYNLLRYSQIISSTYEMGTAETQWGGDHLKHREMTVTRHHMSFDHTISMLMFWGIDKKTVTNVRLLLNDKAFYDGPIEPLERIKEERGLGHVEPVILFISQAGPDSPYQSAVNFSRINSVSMVIGTEGNADTNANDPEIIRYYTVSVHPLVMSKTGCVKRFADRRIGFKTRQYKKTL